MLVLTLLVFLSASWSAAASCGSHPEGTMYPIYEGACLPYYYWCVNGVENEMGCPPGLVFYHDRCDYPKSAHCSMTDISGCTDDLGNSVDGLSYTESNDCIYGYYYFCEKGSPVKKKCPDNTYFDSTMQQCVYWSAESDCISTSVQESTTKDPTASDPVTEEPEVPSSSTHTGGIVVTSPPTGTTEKVPTTTKTTTVPTANGLTYVGFVVDDTGSMSVEVGAVKEWISQCVTGVSSSCGNEPTGGWIVNSFNDPTIGTVVGPTTNNQLILDTIGGYYVYNGGDCPEMALSGLESVASVVPDVNSGCKIYLFTDATAKDSYKETDTMQLLKSKGCAFSPILTGCCGTCPPPPVCNSTNPEYCTDELYGDSRSLTRKVKASSYDAYDTDIFYNLADETGGNIYVTDKPSSTEDMLDFLNDEVTLGFCPTNDIAGPPPGGYECEADCNIMGMCWDKSVSVCYCNDTCVNDPMPNGYSYCDGEQIVECIPNVAEEVIPDMKDCQKYYQCNFGIKNHFTCANGTIYSEASSSHCDHPEDVPPPCGSLVVP